jgi:hypothetical protein
MKLSPRNFACYTNHVRSVWDVESHRESFFGRDRVISFNAHSSRAQIEDFGRNFIQIGLPAIGNERCRNPLSFSPRSLELHEPPHLFKFRRLAFSKLQRTRVYEIGNKPFDSYGGKKPWTIVGQKESPKD